MPEPDALVAALRAAGCVFAEEEAGVLRSSARDEAHLVELRDRRVAGEPLEPLVGWVAFGGLRLAVGPGVFVPRRRTELLAEEAAGLIHDGAVVVELCCGVAPVAAVCADRAARRGLRVEVHAVDLDPVATAQAAVNLGTAGTVHTGDLDAPLPARLRGRVDVLVANAPYVPTAAVSLLPPESRLYEPSATVDGGEDGLDVQRRVVAAAGGWLRPGGAVLVETGADQLPATRAAMAAHGLRARVARDADRAATVVVGVREARR